MGNRIVRSRGRRTVGDYVVPLTYTVEVDDPTFDFTYEVDIDNSGSSPRVAALVCIARPGRSVRGEQLRAVTIAKTVAEAAKSHHVAARPVRRGGRVVGAAFPLSDSEFDAYLKARRREERSGLRRITDEDLQLVASTYLAALAAGVAPTKAVQERLRLRSRAQAARWVRKAREAGFLGDSVGERQAGAAPLRTEVADQAEPPEPDLPRRSVAPVATAPEDLEASRRTQRKKR